MSTEKDYPASGQRVALNEPQASQPGTAEGPEFPSARYFQIHFDIWMNDSATYAIASMPRQQIADLQRVPITIRLRIADSAYPAEWPRRSETERRRTASCAATRPPPLKRFLSRVSISAGNRGETASDVFSIFGTAAGMSTYFSGGHLTTAEEVRRSP